MNPGAGSNVTTPVVRFKVYVPSLLVRVLPVHDATAVVVAQIPTGIAFKVVPAPAKSFATGEYVWFVSQGPVCESGVAIGAPATVGV
jgi:hypothetical protein